MRYLLLACLSLFSPCAPAAAQDASLVTQLEDCLNRLAAEIDTYIDDNDECLFSATDTNDAQAGLTTNKGRRLDLMSSTLRSFARVWFKSYSLEPSSDPNMFRIIVEGAEGKLPFVVPVHGGTYAYAYLSGDETYVMRCNEQLGSCVFYLDVAEYTQQASTGSYQCYVILILTFPTPATDSDAARYMGSVVEFVRTALPADKTRFQAPCADAS